MKLSRGDFVPFLPVLWGSCGKILSSFCYPVEIIEPCEWCDFNGFNQDMEKLPEARQDYEKNKAEFMKELKDGLK